jgi:hypothetical protein
MRYKFLSVTESGNGTDFIMAVEKQPRLWQRWLGRRVEEVEFFGPHPEWVTMQGMIAPPRVQQILDEFWKANLPKKGDWRNVAPWAYLEPAAK